MVAWPRGVTYCTTIFGRMGIPARFITAIPAMTCSLWPHSMLHDRWKFMVSWLQPFFNILSHRVQFLANSALANMTAISFSDDLSVMLMSISLACVWP